MIGKKINLFDILFCKICRRHSNDLNNTFIEGSKLDRKSNLDQHVTTEAHKMNLSKEKDAIIQSKIQNNLKLNAEDVDEEIYCMFKNILFLSYQGIALDKCQDLHTLVSD